MPLPLTFLEDITEEMTYYIAKGSTSAESQCTATNTSIIMKYLIIINKKQHPKGLKSLSRTRRIVPQHKCAKCGAA